MSAQSNEVHPWFFDGSFSKLLERVLFPSFLRRRHGYVGLMVDAFLALTGPRYFFAVLATIGTNLISGKTGAAVRWTKLNLVFFEEFFEPLRRDRLGSPQLLSVEGHFQFFDQPFEFLHRPGLLPG